MSEKRLRVYVANAYSSKLDDPDAAAFQRCQRRALESYVCGKLRKQYNIIPVPPIAMSAAMADFCNFDTGFEEWVGDDLSHIDTCDELWVLVSDGVSQSIGVKAEIEYARKQGLTIKYIFVDDKFKVVVSPENVVSL